MSHTKLVYNTLELALRLRVCSVRIDLTMKRRSTSPHGLDYSKIGHWLEARKAETQFHIDCIRIRVDTTLVIERPNHSPVLERLPLLTS